MAKKRTDVERRLRQCERLSRLLRVLRLILGPGRWDTESLAKELECSRRTIQRDLQTLSMAGVPWYFDDSTRAYRVRPGFRFPALDEVGDTGRSRQRSVDEILSMTRQMIQSSESFLGALRNFCTVLEASADKEDGHS